MSRKPTIAIDKLKENVFQIKYLEATAGLNAREKELFDSIVQSMEPGFFINADSILLQEFIKLKQISDVAYAQLKEIDDMASPEATKVVNIISKTSSAVSTISQKLGICPSSRVKHLGKTSSTEETESDLLD